MIRSLSNIKRASLATVALVMLGGSLISDSAEAAGVAPLVVHVMGSFGDVTQSPSVLGVAEGVSAHGTVGRKFGFFAACTRGNVPVTCHQITWTFGDGMRASGDTALHGYTRSGTFTATASADGGVGIGQLTVLVTPMYSDAQQGPAARAIWALSSVGLASTCTNGRYCPTPLASNGPHEDIITTLRANVAAGAKSVQLSSVIGIWVGQSLTLGGGSVEVTKVSGNTVTVSSALSAGASAGSAAILFPALASKMVNGVTGQACFSSPGACGLPARYFINGVCNNSCRTHLVALGLVTAGPSPELVYDPTNCASGYTATKLRGSWVIGAGEPSGCESKGAYLSLLVALAGGVGPVKNSPCSDAAGIVVREGAALGLTKYLVVHNKCYLSGPLSKLSAYEMLAALSLRLNPSAASKLLDVVNTPVQGIVGGLLARGVPLVGSGTCSSGQGTCFNTGEALSRGEVAQLIASDLLGGSRIVGGTSVVGRSTGGTMHAVVRLANGESASTLGVTITVGTIQCSSRLFVTSAGATTTCQVGISTVGREAAVSVSGGWGTMTTLSYIAAGA